jgi:hypothetical protein
MQRYPGENNKTPPDYWIGLQESDYPEGYEIVDSTLIAP